ncbi:Helicase, SNF2/RAD54 family [hydrothermal vent metagenome]|uniref:Helicase, SNF2/RAD54 family n=1 Tax=hydrothermal vent metagenome TaxID=652676 RepID=A0A3B0Z744_9ZZZZ
MNFFDLGLLPSGRLYVFLSKIDKTKDQKATTTDTQLKMLSDVFKHSSSEGLFKLAIRKSTSELSPSLQYWRHFARQYLSERCQLNAENQQQTDAQQFTSVEPLTANETMPLLLNAPPMYGAEYLSEEVLQNIRSLLDNWVCEQSQASGGLDVFLKKHAPQWHQVGRVCFHLAENKTDPDYPFAFMATYASELSEHGQVRHQPLSRALQEYAGTKNKKALIRLLSPVQLAAESSALIKDLVDSSDLYHPLAWSVEEAYSFLKDAAFYEQCGLVVRLPNWWKNRTRPRIGITIGESKQKNFNTDSLLDFKLHIALGDKSLSKAELQELMAVGNGLTFIKGQWIEVDQDKLREALAHWEKVESQTAGTGLTFSESMRLLAGAPADLVKDELQENREWSFVQPGKWLSAQLSTLNSPDQMKAAKPGKALHATLRPYQQTGVNWLWLLSQLGLGACLADDMGLGKTMQVISLLLIIKKKKTGIPSLLVLPASLLANWQTELSRFAPSLRCLFLHSSQLNKQEIACIANGKTGNNPAFKNVDVVLTTYGTLMRQDWLQEEKWQLLVLDEAQAIKNPSSRQSKSVKKIKAAARIALTGTPVENRILDLWSLFDFINPGLLGSAKRFKVFVKSLTERDHDQYAPLRNLVSPYILRRMKTDRTIISDLPEKTEVTAYCGLSKLQAVQYQQAVSELASAIENIEGMKRRGLVLAYLIRFKQICNHPSQLQGDGEYDPQHSGKFHRLAELCEEISSRQEKLLVFTQFREMTGPLTAFLAEQFREPGLILHGGTPVKQRQKLVARFQDEAGPPFFVLSLKAGGTGLNLTQASHVIHFDRWWNPAVENQATDRAFRIGQKKNVLVHKFVCQGTVEEKIDALIAEKKALAHDLLEGGAETLLTEMDNEALLRLVSLDIEKTKV